MSLERYTIVQKFETQGIEKTEKKVSSLGKKLKTTFNPALFAAFSAISTTAIIGFGKKTLDMAGTLEATERRFERVFKSLSDSVGEFSQSLASDLGRANGAIMSGLVSFQAFFQGLGFGTEDAAEMSKKMQALSLDLASFFDISDAQAQKRFLAALAGSPEVLDQFGINLKQAALQQELYAMGLNSSVQNTDEMTKSIARLEIIMRAMTDNGIVGDARRNMDNYTNTNKRLSTAFGDQSRIIGKRLLPAYKNVAEVIIGLTKANNQMEQAFIDEQLVKAYYDNLSKGAEATKDQTLAAIRAKEVEVHALERENREREKTLNNLSLIDRFKKDGIQKNIDNAKTEIALERSRLEVMRTRAKLQGIINTEELKKTKEIDKNAIAELERMRLLQKYRQQNIESLTKERDQLSELEPLIQAAADADGRYNSELQRTQLKLSVIRDVIKEILIDTQTLSEMPIPEYFDFGISDGLDPLNTDFPEWMSDDQIAHLGDQIEKFDQTLSDGIIKASENAAGAAQELKSVVDSLHMSTASSFTAFSYDMVGIILEGGDNIFKAILESASKMALGLSQQLATQALYHKFRAAAAYTVGNVVLGGAHSAAAGILGRGALKMGVGGLASGLIANSLGGGKAEGIRQLNNGQPVNLQGQSNFGQVLVAQVSGDQLNFVLQNSNNRGYRRTGG